MLLLFVPFSLFVFKISMVFYWWYSYLFSCSFIASARFFHIILFTLSAKLDYCSWLVLSPYILFAVNIPFNHFAVDREKKSSLEEREKCKIKEIIQQHFHSLPFFFSFPQRYTNNSSYACADLSFVNFWRV